MFVSYSVGAPGTGTVVLTATSDVGTTSFGVLNVTVTGSGIPFGVAGLHPDQAFPAIFTGGSLTDKNVSDVARLLDSAQHKHVRMWFNVTGGEQLFYRSPTDHSFVLQSWKDTLDNHASPFNPDSSSTKASQLTPYINNGTLMGFILMDDIGNFNPDPAFRDLEEMARYAKLRYPGVTTALRAVPTLLSTISGGNPYTQVDVGWAQYTSRVGMTAAAFRDANITAARNLGLGLVDGINITEGDGTSTNKTPITTAELLSWGSDLLQQGTSDYVCAFKMWDINYLHLTDPNMTTLANLAKGHVASPCKVH